MLGTAFPASRVLLVEQPGGWGPTGLAASQFDPALARQLMNDWGLQGIRVLAVRRPGRQPAPERRSWTFADCRPGQHAISSGTFEADDELLRLDPDALVGYPDGRAVFAVCAHGTHDVCCAIEGRPVAAALARLRPEQVWECSHVGGDRFAANVLVLPTGQLYGRVPVEAAAGLVDATERGQVLPELLRGQVGLAPIAQAAVVYAQRRLQLLGAGDVQVVRIDPDGDLRQVRVATGRGEFTVTLAVETQTPAKLTCRAARLSTARVYRPVSLHQD